ncbi:MAG: YggT family protein [Chloroflexi bacterium]|nr:YggT family protein [Chloroflexota bacterium]MBP8056218.1 YggT family protein [Chloroflexota bacterium]
MRQIVSLLFTIFYIILLARVLLSWVRVSPYDPTWGPIIRFIHQITEPLLAPIRRLLPATGGLDFSPIIAFFLISLLERLIISLL